MLRDLQNYGSLEKYADLVLMIYRDEYYDPESEDKCIAEIIIRKNRNGPIGSFNLLFEQYFTRFRNFKESNLSIK